MSLAVQTCLQVQSKDCDEKQSCQYIGCNCLPILSCVICHKVFFSILFSEKEAKLKQIVSDLYENNIKPETKVYNIRRTNVWGSLKEKMSRKSFDPCKTVETKFIGEEETVDMGGPRNEMFRLALSDIFEHSGLFEMGPGGYLPTASSVSVCNRDYVSVGVVFAMSIVHRGPAPNGLHPGIAQAVCGRDLEHLNAEEPKEPRLAQFLQKLDNAGENLSDILQDEEAMNILETIGWTKASTTSEDVPTLKRTICLHDIILKRKTAIDQIHQGLGIFGLIDAFDENPSLLDSRNCLTSRTRKLQLMRPHKYEGSVSLKEFIIFVTSFKTKPPTGWPMQPLIQFRRCEEGCSCFPRANTCSFTLTLPEHMARLTKKEFDMKMKRAIRDGWGAKVFTEEEFILEKEAQQKKRDDAELKKEERRKQRESRKADEMAMAAQKREKQKKKKAVV
ncbi:PREDICTED: G2/M phase-specific E3 ubiquitin-protein ligase-like [Branchiostoma belcheri]|uniref:G2/M phase-specific E3 ubiquitin-protein ligase-like n=1 Tax=Branchiostoma belcheri TaxID=7741 RepID=A0A6P4Y2R2_BRABE|nr:PREDICTED: G2/M phase-specific E3 ubiquitin-protein ligase-like [Branchiostoma belcheri]